VVGHDDADDVDVVGLSDRLPGGLRPGVPEAPGHVGGELLVDVGHGDQPHVRETRSIERGGGSISGGVRATGHAGTDHRHSDVLVGHGSPPGGATRDFKPV
jgi:hypothetical protein